MTMTLDEVTAKLLEYMARQDAVISMMEGYTGGVVGGGPNGDGKYPLPSGPGTTRLITCPAQIAFEAARMQIVFLTGSNNLSLVAAHNGCKVLVFNATSAINLTIGADIRPGFSCLVEQYNTGKIHFLPGASAVLRPRLTGYEYTAGRFAVAGVSCDERNSSGTNMINLYGDLTNVA